MNKALNISYFISKSIFVLGIFLFTMLAIRHLIGVEYNYLGGGYECPIEIPVLDYPIIAIGAITCLFSFFYYPLLLLFIIIFSIFRNKTATNKTQTAVSIKRYFMLCLLTFLIGFIVFGMSSYLWDVSNVCN